MTPRLIFILLLIALIQQNAFAGNGALGIAIKKKLERINKGQAIGNENSEFSSGVRFYDKPSVIGTGCNDQNTSITLSPDHKKISVLFSQFLNELDGISSVREVKKCQLHIPIRVPEDMQVSVLRVDYRGFNAMPQAAATNLQALISYTSIDTGLILKQKEQFENQFAGPLNEEYYLGAKFPSPIYSKCGENVSIVIDNTLETQSKQSGAQPESVLSSIDSLDMSTNTDRSTAIHLHWRKCSCKKIKNITICNKK